MQMSVAELSNSTVESDKIPIEVFKTSPLYLRQYQNGELAAELSAREGVLFTTGNLLPVVLLSCVRSIKTQSLRIGSHRSNLRN